MTAVTHENPCCVVGRLNQVIVIDVRHAIQPRHVVEAAALAESMSADGPVDILVRVSAGAGFPAHRARVEFIAFLHAQRHNVRAIHVVLEGRGFWAATMTALIATLARTVPNASPMYVYETVEEAATVLEVNVDPSVSGIVDRARLVKALQRAG